MPGPTKTDARQIVLRAQSPFIGNAANEQLDVVFPRIDAEMAKLYEDRNILLTDGGIITFTGTQIQFTENLKIVLNQKISGASPQVIDLGSANVNLSNLDMWYAILNRTAGTATTVVAATLPAVIAANQEIFLLTKRVDAGDGTQRIYWRNGMAMNAGQSVRLGASGSGTGGSGIGDDLDALQYRASFDDEFGDGPTSSLSAVDVTAAHTDSNAYSAAKAMYQLSYDAGKTIAAGTTTTNINISAVAAFTVKTGDMIINNGIARRITAVASQSSFTTEAFSVAPTLASQVTVSQAVHTKDIYNLAVDGTSLATSFGAATFSNILVDYEDTTTVGDNIFDVNVAPVIAYVASPDGTNYTSVTVRATNQTDTFTSLDLPSAGTGLTLRFFANKSSGSGSVNILRYKAFMQKSLTTTDGGVINQAYAFTNGVGTPVNCTVAVAGGKTTITLVGFTYAVGVNSGAAYGSIDVYLNGQLIPRFINATLTPDASYTETSASVLTLDKDYSALSVNVEILKRLQVVDNSTVNTTNISYQQEIMQNGFQSFVNQSNVLNATATAGTPAAGSFYSAISGRASIVDFSQDLKSRIGIERFETQQIFVIQNEFGPNGEQVWGVLNDSFNQVRFVGFWGNDITSSDGNRIFTSNSSTTDLVEYTFYGTGLNLLTTRPGSRNIAWRVDGGTETLVSNVDGTSGILGSRGSATNTVCQIVSGLTLGIHTVTIRTNAVNISIAGFEVLNEATTIKTQPGISYINGTKLALAAQSSIAHSSSFETGTLGSRGGRVIVYQKSDGTIAKALNPTGSQLNLTSTDHSNEEVVRSYYFREFGANRSDDFSTNGSSVSRAFTLDDGTTTLVASGIDISIVANPNARDGLRIGGTTQYVTFTFVGTGLDILRQDTSAGGADTFSVTVDGTNIGNLSSTGVTVQRRERIVSGLPYGTHTVKILSVSQVTFAVYIYNFIVYQPKKPALPSGAVEIADYNIMATFVANTVGSFEAISTGVLRKLPTREFLYVTGTGGTTDWAIAATIATMNYFQLNSDKLNAAASYTFFGTGFDFRFDSGSNRSGNISVTLNGLAATTANFPTLTSSVYGTGVTFAAGVLDQLDASAGPGSGLVITGLPLALYTVKFNNNTASSFLILNAFDVITPIHSVKSNIYGDYQNTLPVGSCAISDSRKITPVKDALPLTKGWAQSSATTSNPTVTGTTAVPMPDMSVVLKMSQNGVADISYSASMQLDTAGTNWFLQMYIDGVLSPTNSQNSDRRSSTNVTNGYTLTVADRFFIPLSAGAHKIDLYWYTNAGTLTAYQQERRLMAREL